MSRVLHLDSGDLLSHHTTERKTISFGTESTQAEATDHLQGRTNTMADTDLEEAVGLMGMDWEDVDDLFQKALVMNLEDLYEIGASDNFDYRQLLGPEDCKIYAESILRIHGFFVYLRTTLRIDMDLTEEATAAQDWSTLRLRIRSNSLRRCIIKETKDLPLFIALMEVGEETFREMRARARGLPSPIISTSPARSSNSNQNPPLTTPGRNLSISFEERTIHSEASAQVAHQMPTLLNDAAFADQEVRNQAVADLLRIFDQTSSASRLSTKLIIRPPLYDKVQWNGKASTWPAFRQAYEGWLYQSSQAYALDPGLCLEYIQRGWDGICLHSEVTLAGLTETQFTCDLRVQYGAIKLACHNAGSSAMRFLHAYPKDGIKVWNTMMKLIDSEGNVHSYIAELSQQLGQPYHSRYPGGVLAYLDMIASVYSAKEQAILRSPGIGITLPSDKDKMIHVMTHLQDTMEASDVYDFFEQHSKGQGTILDFMEDIRSKVKFTDNSDRGGSTGPE